MGELAPISFSVNTCVRVVPLGAAGVTGATSAPVAAVVPVAGPGRVGLLVGVRLCGAIAPGTIWVAPPCSGTCEPCGGGAAAPVVGPGPVGPTPIVGGAL